MLKIQGWICVPCPHYELCCLQEHGIESAPAKNQDRVEHAGPPRADLSKSVAPGYQQQNHCSNSNSKFEYYDLVILMYDRTREGIQFPYTSHTAGNEGTEQVVNIQHGNQNNQPDDPSAGILR